LKEPQSTGKDFYTKRAEILINNETELKNVLKNLPKDEAQIPAYFKTQFENAKSEDLKTIYKEFIELGDGNSQASRASRTIERFAKIKRACNGTFTPDKYRESMVKEENELLRRLRKFAEISKGLEESPESIKETITKIAENCKYNDSNKKIFHNISTFGQNVQELKTKICKDVVKGYKDMLKGRYRFIKEVAGISLGLFVTVPLTCHALNWVYPRFMDIFFPNLAGTHKNNVQNAMNKTGGEK
jgi:hypothetical protein